MDLCIPMTHRLVKKEGFKLLLQSGEEDIAPGTGERSFFRHGYGCAEEMIFSITTCSPLCSLEHKDTQTALLNNAFLFPSKRIKIMQYLASWQAVTVLRILCLVIEEILKAILGEMFLQDVYNTYI